jgi:methyl coenzyme M reductase subunit D
MKTIPLTRGMVALVDDADFEFLNQWKWFSKSSNRRKLFYAARWTRTNGIRICVLMHRVLIGAKEGQQVDHKDRCSLNNQKSNLRLSNQSQNLGNKSIGINNTSGYKGIIWNKRLDRWCAQICVNYNKVWLGTFNDKQSAVQAYDRASKAYFGQFSANNHTLGLVDN